MPEFHGYEIFDNGLIQQYWGSQVSDFPFIQFKGGIYSSHFMNLFIYYNENIDGVI